MCYVLSRGCRETVYRTPNLKRSAGLTYLNKLYLTSPVCCTTQLKFSVVIYVYIFLHFCGLTCSVLFFLFVCVVWFSSIVWGGHRGGTAAGMWGHVSSVSLCKYPPYIHHQTIKIILQPSITVSLSSSAAIVSRVSEKKHLKHLFNRTGKTDLSLCGQQLIVLNKWYSNQKSPCITLLISQGHLCAILMA